jgi:hypothetical protein
MTEYPRLSRPRGRSCASTPARKVLGWPNRCKLARAFPWDYSYKRLTLAQLLGRHRAFLTCSRPSARRRKSGPALGRPVWIYEGALSFVTEICCTYRDSTRDT